VVVTRSSSPMALRIRIRLRQIARGIAFTYVTDGGLTSPCS